MDVRYCEILINSEGWFKSNEGVNKNSVCFYSRQGSSTRDSRSAWAVFMGCFFGHPTYSPSHAPSDFHLFPQLKQHLADSALKINEGDLKKEVENWLSIMTVVGMVVWCRFGKTCTTVPKVHTNHGNYIENEYYI